MGEITIKRYLDGSVPSERYSDLLKSVLKDPLMMKKYIQINKDKITQAAYDKTIKCINEMEQREATNSKIEVVACYIRDSQYDVTNMSLQKLLYYVQGIGVGVYDKVIFSQRCQAWKHGSVYPCIYEQYRDYRASLIPSCDILIDYSHLFEEDEKKIIDLVVRSFG